MSQKDDIKTIISSLRRHKTLSAKVVSDATSDLAKLNYRYDGTLFPPLPFPHNWVVPSLTGPQTLAEALLWKMGKWKVYKSFVEHFKEIASEPKNTDVVFYAFAKHLNDPARPIYDQHALRALWAIDFNLTQDQIKVCRRLLTKKKSGEWKPIASGSKAQEGYKLYADRVTQLCGGGVSLRDVDKLLMPLGQALKDHTKTVDEFFEITNGKCHG